MDIITYGDETARRFGGCGLLVKPVYEDDEENENRQILTGYQYCVVLDEYETNWNDASETDIETAFAEAESRALDFIQAEIEDALKSDARAPYAWMIEGVDVTDYSEDMIEELVKGHAENVFKYSGDIPEFVTETIAFEDFLKWSDYDQAVREVKQLCAERQAHFVLDSIITPAEAQELFGVKSDTVRDACQNGYITARKSGSTWLMLRSAAEKRWNKQS